MTADVARILGARGLKMLVTGVIALVLAIGTLTVAGPAANAAGQAPALGTAANLAVLAGNALTCSDGIILGNVGVYSGALTQTSCPISGTIAVVDTVAGAAQTDFVTAYNQFAALPCDQTLATLVTLTLAPGVYCFDAAATATGKILTLEGPANGIWIFKIGVLGTGALTGTSFGVFMAGGGQASNVYWQSAQAVTMTDSTFLGTILAGEGITMTRGTFHGAALSNAGVTITGTAVTGFAGAGGN